MESTRTVLAAAVPPVTVTSLAGKALMAWLKVKVKVTGPLTAVAEVPVMATVGTAGGVEDEELLPQPRNRAGRAAARRAARPPPMRRAFMVFPLAAA